MAAGRVIHAGLQLLDRQLVDRDGQLCGKVDDLELTEPDDAGRVFVDAVLSGPGALLSRTGHVRLGGWLRRLAAVAFPAERHDPVRIPFGRVADIGDHVTLSMDRDEVATFATERWVRQHVIGHIPGSGSDAPG
jgi:sporulation protein YlmC with PRC-barrel domain